MIQARSVRLTVQNHFFRRPVDPWIEVRATKTGFALITTDGFVTVRLATTRKSENWRVLLRPLREGACLNVEDGNGPFYDPKDVAFDDGPDAFSEMLALAWVGGPYGDFSTALGSLPDDGIEQMREAWGTLLHRDLMRILRCVGGGADVVRVLERSYPTAKGRTVVSGLRYMRRAASAERELERIREDWSVFPFQEQVEAVVNRYSTGRSRHSGGGDASHLDVRAYCRRYVAEHREMPTGVHVVPNSRAAGSFQVDFDRCVQVYSASSADS